MCYTWSWTSPRNSRKHQPMANMWTLSKRDGARRSNGIAPFSQLSGHKTSCTRWHPPSLVWTHVTFQTLDWLHLWGRLWWTWVKGLLVQLHCKHELVPEIHNTVCRIDSWKTCKVIARSLLSLFGLSVSLSSYFFTFVPTVLCSPFFLYRVPTLGTN